MTDENMLSRGVEKVCSSRGVVLRHSKCVKFGNLWTSGGAQSRIDRWLTKLAANRQAHDTFCRKLVLENHGLGCKTRFLQVTI